MLTGAKHLVKCRCILPQFKQLENPPAHQFIVFSAIEDDKVVTKIAQCNNCGLVHKVTDICTSEIISNKEDSTAILGIDDVKLCLPENLVKILDLNSVDLPTWEMVAFYYENKLWGNFVVLNSEYDSGVKSGKILQILGENLFKINSFSREEVAR